MLSRIVNKIQLPQGITEQVKRNGHQVHADDIADIIGTPPNILVRWGISCVLLALMAVITLSAYIQYPDIVRAPARINAANVPKVVVARVSGNIINILVEAGDSVQTAQPLAWMESTADHSQVLNLYNRLLGLQDTLLGYFSTTDLSIVAPTGLQLGELQGSYQTFYQSYLNYRSASGDGIFLKRRAYIMDELANIEAQKQQLETQQKLQQSEYALAETDFKRYEELAERKVISPAEYQQQQASLLVKRYPIQQTASALLLNAAQRTAKMRELSELNNQIAEEKLKFMQALNSLISEMQQWKMQHILVAPQAGNVVYAGIIQPNQHLNAGEEVFYVNPGSSEFFAEVNVPQYNMGKVQVGQKVLIKLDSYPFEEYGALHGKIGQLNQVPYRDSVFLSRVDILPIKVRGTFKLTTGMIGTAEIITEDASLLQRLARNIRLIINSRS